MSPLKANSLRVIGGQWRRRVIEFAKVEAIRPTPDRIRETLFNWLQHDLHNARCLELFAGSGILSVEALSRGAAHCTIVDLSGIIIEQIEDNLKRLGATVMQYQCSVSGAQLWLANHTEEKFDLIFLDPPFADDSLEEVVAQCEKLLTAEGYLYVESPEPLNVEDLPQSLSIYRQKRSGAVNYALLERA